MAETTKARGSVSDTALPNAFQKVITDAEQAEYDNDPAAVCTFRPVVIEGGKSKTAPDTWNDALLKGHDCPEWQELLDRVVTFFTGTHGKYTKWPVATASWRQWIEGGPAGGFSIHRSSTRKATLAVVMASFTGTARKANAVTHLHALALDFDNGTKRTDVEAKIEKLGMAAIVYTSHSDQKKKSNIAHASLERVFKGRNLSKLTDEDLREYLTDHAPDVFSAEHIETAQITFHKLTTSDGYVLEYTHAPMDKFRVVFPLAESVDVMKMGRDGNERKNIWADKVTGAARVWLDGHFDIACTDMTRVFYMPEHPPEFTPYLAIYQGRPATFDEIPSASKRDYVKEYRTPVAIGGTSSTDPLLPSGERAVVWAAGEERVRRLRIGEMLNIEARDRVRQDKGNGLYVVECPFEHFHSSQGGTGTHVQDGAGEGDTGFSFECKHNSCAGRDRLEMLCEAFRVWLELDENHIWTDLGDGGYLWDLSDDYHYDVAADAEESPTEQVAEPDNEAEGDTGGTASADGEFEPRDSWLDKRYKVVKGLILKTGGKKRGEDETSDTKICQVFDVVGRSSNADGTAGAGRIISFKNENGKTVELTIPLADIMTDGNAVVRELSNAGLYICGRGPTASNGVLDLLKFILPKRQIPTVDTPGWFRDEHGEIVGFVLPTGEYVGRDGAGPIRLLEGSRVDYPKPRGSTDKFTAAVIKSYEYADTNFYWTLGMAAGFAGPILGLLKEKSCGIVFSGHSSLGKTLGQQLGAAVWGSPEDGDGLLHSGSTTPNAIEDLCVRATHTTFMFDEVGAFEDKRHLESVLFKMSGGVSKARKKDRNVGLAQRVKYNPFVVLSSEFGIKQEIESGGGKYRAGLVARFPDIDVSGGEKVDKATRDILEAVQQNYGHAGPAFVRYLIDSGVAANRDKLVQEVDAIVSELADGRAAVIGRAAKPFAIVQRAGELAAEAGVLGGDKEAAKKAIQTAVLTAWNVFTGSDEAGAASSGAALMDRITAKLNGLWDRTIIKAGGITDDGKAMDDADGAEARGTPLGWYDDHHIYLDWAQLEDPATALGIPMKRAELVNVLRDAVDRKSEREAPQAKLPAHVAKAADGDGRSVKNLKLRRDRLGM